MRDVPHGVLPRSQMLQEAEAVRDRSVRELEKRLKFAEARIHTAELGQAMAQVW